MNTDVGGVWNRDAAYHPWIVRIAAEHAGDVLDVGCGDGLLAERLADVSRTVVAIDRDPVAVGQTRKRLQFVRDAAAEVSEFGSEWGLAPESFDVVTMVSVLHELPLVPALERARELLKPGGTLLVVGHTAPATWTDRAIDVASAGYGRALEFFHAWRGMYLPEFRSAQPVAPSYSFTDVADAVAELLPGAELHRGLFGRFRLRWSKPVDVLPADAGLDAFDSAVTAAQTGELDRSKLAAATEGGASAGLTDLDELTRLFDEDRQTASHVRRSA